AFLAGFHYRQDRRRTVPARCVEFSIFHRSVFGILYNGSVTHSSAPWTFSLAAPRCTRDCSVAGFNALSGVALLHARLAAHRCRNNFRLEPDGSALRTPLGIALFRKCLSAHQLSRDSGDCRELRTVGHGTGERQKTVANQPRPLAHLDGGIAPQSLGSLYQNHTKRSGLLEYIWPLARRFTSHLDCHPATSRFQKAHFTILTHQWT